jgi:hypothetical protein
LSLPLGLALLLSALAVTTAAASGVAELAALAVGLAGGLSLAGSI